MSERTVYLMRGLPACGKSFEAKRLAGDTGVIVETDEYFYTQVGQDITRYDYRDDLLPAARRWNYERFVHAVEQGVSPIIVDRGNGLNEETQKYVKYAINHGYDVHLREPESAWWQEIRVLLKYKDSTKEILYLWADRLAAMSRSTHRVPSATIKHWMDRWQYDLSVEDILAYQPRSNH